MTQGRGGSDVGRGCKKGGEESERGAIGGRGGFCMSKDGCAEGDADGG